MSQLLCCPVGEGQCAMQPLLLALLSRSARTMAAALRHAAPHHESAPSMLEHLSSLSQAALAAGCADHHDARPSTTQ